MNSKQLGLTEYNDVILSLYDANPVASVGDSVKKAPEPENKSEKPKGPTVRKVGTKSLLKETYKMRLAAVANLKLRKRMFEYEKQRFKQLTVDVAKLSKEDKDDAVKRKKKKKELEDTKGGFNFGKLLRNLFRNLARRLKVNLKRKIPRNYRKRWKQFRKAIQVRSKRFFRNLTKPFRQAGRALKNLPTRAIRGVTDLFTEAGRARSLSRANASYARYIKGTANLGDKFRLLGRGFISPAQALSKGGPGALVQPITPNIFRDTFDQLGKPLQGVRTGLTQGATAVADTFQTGKANLIKGTAAATDAISNTFQRFTNFASKTGDEALKGTNRFLDDAVKFGKSAVGTLTRWGKVLADPQTYVKIKNQFAAGIDKLKGAAKALYDALIERVASHPMFKKVVESRVGKKVFSKLGRKALGKLLGKLIIGVGTALAIWEAIEDFAKGDYEGAALAILSAIPLFGIIPAVIDILKELFPQSWENIVSGITGKNESERNMNIKEMYDTTFKKPDDLNLGVNDPGFGAAFAEGGIVPAKPQLVLVGEGGEEEFIVPKSKLNYFLGSDAALQVMNAGASAVFSSASEYLKSTGLIGEAKSFIPELAFGNELESTVVPKSGSKQHTKLSVGDKIKETILDTFKGIFEKIKNLIPKIPDGLKNVAGGIINSLIGGRPANAATSSPIPRASSLIGSKDFGAVSGTSGSVAYGGRTEAELSVAYSPFKASDIQSQGISIISGKGYRQSTNSNHKGYDLPAVEGTPLYAYLPGKVTRSQRFSGYGFGIEWQDSVYNQKHFFAHMMEQSPLKPGQTFEQGALLGKTGDTGTPGSYHLHWEIGGRGSEIDPGQWVNSHPLPAKGPDDEPSPLNNDRPSVEPTPEPNPEDLLELFTAPIVQASTPQILPIPVPMNNSPSSGGLTLPQYQSWGLGITGN